MSGSGLSIESWKKEMPFNLREHSEFEGGQPWPWEGVGVGMAEGCAPSHQRWKLFPLTLHGVAPHRTPASLNITIQKGYSFFP